jgi:ribose-phosphate pyrophosphokinase
MPTNDNIMELLLMLDAFKRASAKRLTAVIPYYGYARQDRKVAPRVPISAKLIADLITTCRRAARPDGRPARGADPRLLQHPRRQRLRHTDLLQYLRERLGDRKVTVVSPDAGGVERARAFAKRLDASLAVIDKRRSRPGVVADMQIIGDVDARTAVLGRRHGRYRRHALPRPKPCVGRGAVGLACATHPVLSGRRSRASRRRHRRARRDGHHSAWRSGATRAQDPRAAVAPLLAEAIRRIHEEASISSLFV